MSEDQEPYGKQEPGVPEDLCGMHDHCTKRLIEGQRTLVEVLSEMRGELESGQLMVMATRLIEVAQDMQMAAHVDGAMSLQLEIEKTEALEKRITELQELIEESGIDFSPQTCEGCKAPLGDEWRETADEVRLCLPCYQGLLDEEQQAP